MNDALEVTINGGSIRGTWRDSPHGTVRRFTALPYRGEPRTTSEHFSPPLPVRPWDEPLDTARRRGTRATLSVTAPAKDTPVSDTEDTAGRVPGPAPVIVYVHGGRYESGHGDTPWYIGESFAANGCVFVSISYRIRFEGFLPLEGEPLPSDWEDTEAAYFRGAEDVLAALRWVNDNIAAFGGDPNNVTLMGQSAGGALTTWMMQSPRAAGLFHRAVVLSQGFPRIGWGERLPVAEAFLGGPASFSHISTLTPDQVTAAYRRFARCYPTDCALGLYPYQPEKLRDIPLLIGTMRDEFVRMGIAEKIDRAARSSNPIRRHPARLFQRRASRILHAPKDPRLWHKWLEYNTTHNPSRPLGRAIGDSAIRRWDLATMEAHCTHAPTWAYEFHGGEGNVQENHTDAQHCADLPLLFNCLYKTPITTAQFCGPDAETRLQPLATAFHQLVVDFAHGTNPPWPTYHPDTGRMTAEFDMAAATQTVASDPLKPLREFFPRLY